MKSEHVFRIRRRTSPTPCDGNRHKRSRLFIIYALVYAAIGLIVVSCGDQQNYKAIDFSQTISVAHPEQNNSDRSGFRLQ